MNSPKVSVCIPVYNGSNYIAECIESVLGQTYKDFRLIICDNCSTDNTADIVRSFRDSRITYVRNPENLGLVGNTNRCLSLAEGEYICILHHDDMMLPENLERKVRLLDENSGVGFVHSNIFVIDSKGQILREWIEDSRRDYIEDGMKVFHRYITRMPLGAMVFIGAVLARRSCYQRLGQFLPDPPHCNDSEMWMRMSLFYNVGYIGTPLVKWRQHSTSESSELGLEVDWLEEHYLATKIILNKYRDRIPHRLELREQVFENFAKEAFIRGREAFWRGNYALSKGYLKFAVRVHPKFIQSKEFWWLIIRLLAGPKLGKVYRSVKRRLGRRDEMYSKT
jgi:glycosyltransferase involved in cell wall biosynthesis